MKTSITTLITCALLAAPLASQAAVGYSTSATPPSTNVIASYDDDSTASMSFRNLDDGSKDRTLGQSFTVTGPTDITTVSLQMGNNTGDYTESPEATAWLAIWEVGGAQIGDTVVYDLKGFQMTADEWITFEFDAISLPAAGEYAFEFAWKDDGGDTFDHSSLNFPVKRTPQTNPYLEGGQVSKADYTTFPNIISPNGTNDLHFFVQGTEGQGLPQWAGFDIVNESGDVDTGTFLGWVNVAQGDWVWSYGLSGWIYLPENIVSEAGAWGYVIAP
jgi:hypothetical protein